MQSLLLATGLVLTILTTGAFAESPWIDALSSGCDRTNCTKKCRPTACLWLKARGVSAGTSLRMRYNNRRQVTRIPRRYLQVRGEGQPEQTVYYLFQPRIAKLKLSGPLHLWLENEYGERSQEVMVYPDNSVVGVPSMEQVTGLRLSMFDGFNESGLRNDWWSVGYGWTKYPPGTLFRWLPPMVREGKGLLTLKCRYRPGYREFNPNAPEGHDYACGGVVTEGKFAQQYGLFEVRLKTASARGLNNAAWFAPNLKNSPVFWLPEIDVLEILTREPRTAFFTNHWDPPGNNTLQSNQSDFSGPNFSESFHTFGMVWEPTKIDYYVDGVLRARHTESIPQEPLMMLLTLAAGGKWAGPVSIDDLAKGGNMQVDWVAVYQGAGG